MDISNLLKDKIFTVSEVIDLLNEIMKPCRVTVKGEVGEDINMYPGFGFFKLVDKEGSTLPCFAFRNVFEDTIELKPGMEIKVSGYPEIRKKRGSFNFQVKRINPIGEGQLKKQFEILKKKLKEEGFFDEEKKEEIPPFLRNIGLITSNGSDAEKDFLTHLKEFGFQVFAYDSRVEGDSAVNDIIKGIKTLNQRTEPEVIVITRGGGSWESLQAFNSPETVKAAFSSKIPVISAVGHENDVTLLDLVADKRVSTPTDAGKFISRSWEEGKNRVFEIEKNISVSTIRMIKKTEEKFKNYTLDFTRKIESIALQKEKNLNYLFNGLTDKIKNRLEKFYFLEKKLISKRREIKILIKKRTEEIEDFKTKINKDKKAWIGNIKKDLEEERKKLFLSDPRLKLKQGYSITKKNGKIVKSVKNIKKGDKIETGFSDGFVNSEVNQSILKE